MRLAGFCSGSCCAVTRQSSTACSVAPAPPRAAAAGFQGTRCPPALAKRRSGGEGLGSRGFLLLGCPGLESGFSSVVSPPLQLRAHHKPAPRRPPNAVPGSRKVLEGGGFFEASCQEPPESLAPGSGRPLVSWGVGPRGPGLSWPGAQPYRVLLCTPGSNSQAAWLAPQVSSEDREGQWGVTVIWAAEGWQFGSTIESLSARAAGAAG